MLCSFAAAFMHMYQLLRTLGMCREIYYIDYASKCGNYCVYGRNLCPSRNAYLLCMSMYMSSRVFAQAIHSVASHREISMFFTVLER